MRREATQPNKRKPKIVRELDLESMSSTDVNYTINSNKGPKQTLEINGTYYTFLLDIGASENILDKATYSKIGKPVLETTDQINSCHMEEPFHWM